jgi:hypothetical protein
MASVTEVRKFVSEYLDRDISGEVFGERVVRLLYELAPNSEPGLREIVHALNSRVAQIHLGLISDYDFRTSLLPYSDKSPEVKPKTLATIDVRYEVEDLEFVA